MNEALKKELISKGKKWFLIGSISGLVIGLCSMILVTYAWPSTQLPPNGTPGVVWNNRWLTNHYGPSINNQCPIGVNVNGQCWG